MEIIWSKEVFAKNLKRYIEEKGILQKELADIVGVSSTSVNDWVNGKKFPRIDKIEMLADYFGILKSDLIEDKSMKDQPEEMALLAASIMRDPELLEMIRKYRKLSDKNQKAVLQMIDNLSE